MKRIAAALAVAGGVLLGVGGTVDAYPIGSATVSVDDTTPEPGATFEVEVDSCEAGTDVVFLFEGVSTTVACDDDGASASFAAPVQPGTYTGTVTVDSGDGSRVLSFTVTVEAAPTTTTVTAPTTTVAPGGQLPETGGGSSSGTTITIALVLLVAGAGMFGVANMRRRQNVAA